MTAAENERRHILRTLRRCSGNRAKAARELGISRQTLVRRLAVYQNGHSPRAG